MAPMTKPKKTTPELVRQNSIVSNSTPVQCEDAPFVRHFLLQPLNPIGKNTKHACVMLHCASNKRLNAGAKADAAAAMVASEGIAPISITIIATMRSAVVAAVMSP